MTTEVFDKAQSFIWKNARLLDRQYFSLLFYGAPYQAVVAAIKAYQNADGGFGNALEPDLRAPESQPVTTQFGLELLDLAGALADPQVQREVVLPAYGFLQSITTTEGGVPFSLPSANAYPHAPWMHVADAPPAAQLNPTAQLAGLLLKHNIRHPWLEGAVAFCRRAIGQSETEQYHDLVLMALYLKNDPDAAWAKRELERVAERVRKPGVVEMDPAAGGYVKMPLDWAPEPASFFRPLFDDATIQRHLAALIARQRPDGGWPVTWDPLSPAAEAEWRGRMAVDALRTLRAYGAL